MDPPWSGINVSATKDVRREHAARGRLDVTRDRGRVSCGCWPLHAQSSPDAVAVSTRRRARARIPLGLPLE